MNICIVIPVYKNTLSHTESIALKQCLKVLSDFDIFFCEPESLNTSIIRKDAPSILVEKFEDDFFKSILGYNKLMLSSGFYERFNTYDYLLLYQLDAYVFKNELVAWCEKNYDYIGSPWLASKPNIFKKIKTQLFSKEKKEREQIFFKVGNGGLSLRKVSTFIHVSKNYKSVIEQELKRSIDDFRLMEDVFWSIKAPQLISDFKIPNYKEAVFFSLDRRPKIGFKLTKGKLPFGCHGFNKRNVIDFWKLKISGL